MDIGSTTVKLAVLDPRSHQVLFSDHRRHGARQVETTADLCQELAQKWPGRLFRIAVCGSGSKDVADALDVPYIQQVVANSIAIRELYPQVRTAIEQGGQAPKIIFDESTDTISRTAARKGFFKGQVVVFRGFEFVDQLASHIPPRPVQLVRQYGIYAGKVRAQWVDQPTPVGDSGVAGEP